MALRLLDTDAIIDYLAGMERTVSLVRRLHGLGDLLGVCDVVIAEVYSGLKPEDRENASPLLSTLRYLPTSPQAARQAGEWRYAYARQGVTLSTADVLVAATAHAHQATVVTGNVTDYPMPELEVLPLPR